MTWEISKGWFQNIFICIAYCNGSLTSPLYIDSCWVYLTLRSLTSLLYVTHVCKGSLTSLLIHCLLCIMWLGSSHLFSCNACMQWELTLCLSLSMYIAYISLLLVFLSPLCWWIDKKGEKYFESLYMHVYFFVYAKRGKRIWWVYACLFPYLCIYVLFGLCISLNIFMFIAMYELRGSFYEA